MKKNLKYILVAICGIAIIIAVLITSDKNLKVDSKEVGELYNKLGVVDINRCGGLNTYNNKEITYDDISNENRLCMAYYQITNKNLPNLTAKVTETNESGTKICKIGDITLSANDNEDTCSYEEINIKDLQEAYKNLYGKDLKDNESFYISAKNACYKEGEKYLCGTAETYKMSIAPDSNTYRVINKAIKKLNGDIIIEDLFLKISENTCYTKQSASDKNEDCAKEIKDKNIAGLSDDEIIALVKKYGTTYKHTFKKQGKTNYWYKTEIKN